MPCPSLPGLVASDIILTTLLLALICSLQKLAYVCFSLAEMPYILEVLTSYHIVICKAISYYMSKALH